MSRRKDKKKSAGDVKAIFNVKNIHKDVDRDSLIRNLKVDLPPSPPPLLRTCPLSRFFLIQFCYMAVGEVCAYWKHPKLSNNLINPSI